MEFHDYASTETVALLGRLLAHRSDAPRQQLQTMRDALDAAARALDTPPTLDQDVQELVGKLTQAASDAVRRAQEEAETSLASVQAALQAQRAETERLTAFAAETEAAVALLQSELQEERERAEGADRDLTVTVEAHTELEAAFKKMEAACRHEMQARTAADDQLLEVRGLLDLALAETTELREALDGQRTESAALNAALADARGAHEHLEAAHRTADAASRQEVQARVAAEGALQDARGLLDLALAETEQLRGQLDGLAAEQATLKGELAAAVEARAQRDLFAGERDAAVAQLEEAGARVRTLEDKLTEAVQAEARLREQTDTGDQQRTGLHAEVLTLRGEVDRMVSMLETAVHANDILASAATVGEVLAALVQRLSGQFSRVALFRLKGNRLEGEAQAGFDQTHDVTKLALPLTMDSMMTRVISSGNLEYRAGEQLATGAITPFAGTPAAALAMPVVLQGQTIAVVYADHAGIPDSGNGVAQAASVGFAKLLVAQTAVLLMRHTEELKMLAELRDYAVMLLQEAEHMYVADGETGKSASDLRKRLKDNLDCACQLYAHRAALEGTAAATLLDEQIAVAIEADTPFAQDLATILGQPCETDSLCTAEAS